MARGAVAVLAFVVLSVTGFAWWSSSLVIGGFNVSSVLANPKFAKSVGGATNILLMGLDTRKDQDGNQLPADVLSQLHAGDGNEGGYNTNTLILIHVPADGKNIKAFSIPRDDYVEVDDIDGVGHAKIKEAYGRKKAQAEDALVARGVSDPADLEHQGREAARAETLATVEKLVGVPIDHFVEVSLVGFYDLAKQLGGVDVCLNHAVHDSYSGADFPAGRQHLNAAQALSFVRQRHGLSNGDLDRTHRQQAFIASVALSLQQQGVLGNVNQLRSMLAVAQKDVVISDGWDVSSFIRQIGDIAATNLEFTTLPVEAYGVVDGQDVNLVDPAKIRGQVQKAFGQSIPETAPESSASGVSEVAQTTAAPAPAREPSPGRAAASSTRATLDGPVPTTGAAPRIPGSAQASIVADATPDAGTVVRSGQVPCVD